MLKNSRLMFAAVIVLMTTQYNLCGAQVIPPPPPQMQEVDFPVQQEIVHDMALKVHANPKIPKAFRPSCEQVAAMMTGARIGVPANRVAHFNQMVNQNTPPVVGWHAFVENVEPLEAGVLVTVRITALRGLLHDNAHLMEQYTIVGGQVNYVGAFQPKPYVRALSSL